MKARLCSHGRTAFSLVEIALTMGIISFALVAIFGLLSVGINAARDSNDDTKIAFVMQDLAVRVRAEASTLTLSADPTKMDLTWSTVYGNQLSYTILGNTPLPPDGTGQPQPSATAYYTADGVLVKRSTAAAPTANYYKAAIYIQPLNSYPANASPAPIANSATINYPFLAVTVKVGWPTDINGNVLGASNATKSVFTFYLPKP